MTVAAIRPDITVDTGPNMVCVEILSSLLEQAKRGEVVDVIFVAIDNQEGLLTGWSMVSRNLHEVLGALEIVKMEYMDFNT
jgi:hypothetical protein